MRLNFSLPLFHHFSALWRRKLIAGLKPYQERVVVVLPLHQAPIIVSDSREVINKQ